MKFRRDVVNLPMLNPMICGSMRLHSMRLERNVIYSLRREAERLMTNTAAIHKRAVEAVCRCFKAGVTQRGASGHQVAHKDHMRSLLKNRYKTNIDRTREPNV